MSDVQRVSLQLADGADRTCVWETDHIQIMRIRMAAGETLPHHNSNSHVLLVPLQGVIELTSPGSTETCSSGEALSVPFDTPMDIRNTGDEEAVLLVLKTPHPRNIV